MTAPSDLVAAPVSGGWLGGVVRRHAGLFAASAVALAWLLLALRAPETTYHLAPLLVAGSWGAARRFVDQRPEPPARGVAAAAGGVAVASVTAFELFRLGALAGPTVWGNGSALAESLALAAAGGALSFRFVTRRRAGWLYTP